MLAVVREFFKHAVAAKAVDASVLGALYEVGDDRFLPAELRAEGGGLRYRARPRHQLRAGRAASPEAASQAEWEALLEAATSWRERFLLVLLWFCGLRIGETLGLRRADLHFTGSSTSLGCRVPGPHLHVVHRDGNPNGASAKSRSERTVPVVAWVLAYYDRYTAERLACPAADGCDFVFVNLFHAPLGAPMTASAVRQVMRVLSRRAGLARPVHPHMLRHSSGSEMADAGVPIERRPGASGPRVDHLRAALCAPEPGSDAQRRRGGRESHLAASRTTPGRRSPVNGGRAERAGRPSEALVPEEELRSVIDWAALGRLGFAPGVALFAPGAEDPVFGFAVCRAASCDQVVHSGSLGLCWRCGQLWQKAGQGADFEVFCATVPGRTRHNRGGALCRVCRTPGHERPVRSHGLCTMCSKAMANRGQSPDEYVNGDAEYEAAVPRPAFGRCLVTVCDRWAWRSRPALCEAHDETWLAASGRREARSGSGAPASAASTAGRGSWCCAAWPSVCGSRFSTPFNGQPRPGGGQGPGSSRVR